MDSSHSRVMFSEETSNKCWRVLKQMNCYDDILLFFQTLKEHILQFIFDWLYQIKIFALFQSCLCLHLRVASLQLKFAKSILDSPSIRHNAQTRTNKEMIRDEIPWSVLKQDFFVVRREGGEWAFLSRVPFRADKSDTSCSVTSLVQSLHDYEALSFKTGHSMLIRGFSQFRFQWSWPFLGSDQLGTILCL